MKALKAPGLDNQAVILKLALQAQKQCNQTLEALGAIKNPPTVTMVRQTNIGQAVQVNNGTTAGIPAENLENKLLEQENGQRLDTQTQSAPISDDSIWQPWRSATGPKTKNGKAKSASNADKGMDWSALRKVRKTLRPQKRLLQSLDI